MPATQRTRQDRTAHSSAQTLGPVLRHHWQTPSTIAETSKYTPSTPLLHPPPITPAPNSHQITPLRRRQTSMGPLSRAEMGSFDRLPRELFEAILLACTYAMPKHQAASLRLINKEWNAFLRPRICCTLGLDFTRLSRNSSFTPPDMSVLDSLAPFCKSLYIDLRAMRDDQEIDILNNVITKVPPVDTASHELMNSYCMDDTTFTEIEYLDKLSEMLLRCPNVEGLRLNLPFQLMGKNSIVGKFILANSLKAFATRPEEESAPLKKLVIENITDSAIYDLATNPLDLGYLLAVTGNLEHLVLSVRRNELSLRMHSVVGTALCQVLQDAENLHTLCIVGTDKDGETIPITAYESGDYEYADLIIMSLPMMGLTTTSITRLELKNVLLEYTSIMGIAESCALEELYLTDISLVTLQPADMEEDILDILWIGLPNRRQGEGGLWVAPYLRVMLPNLRVCRATSIGYSAFLEGGNVDVSAHDITDPTGRARTLAQRFVEVVMGYEQPAAPDGKHIEYFPPAFFSSKEAPPDKPPMGRGDITSYDVTAYQTAVDNTTSYLLKSIDGLFVDFNGRTTEDLHRIAMLVYSGLKQIHVSQSVSDPFHPTEEYLQMLWSASDTQGEYMDT